VGVNYNSTMLHTLLQLGAMQNAVPSQILAEDDLATVNYWIYLIYLYC
jgi:hypothetical protein